MKKKLIILIIIILIIYVFCYCQNNIITTTNYIYSSKEIPDQFDGYRIVQISDLHNKEFGKQSKHLIKKIKQLTPDIIVITGDLVDSNHTNVQVAIDFLQEANKIAPCYYITGNHEVWLEDSVMSELLDKIKTSNTIILDNKVVELSQIQDLQSKNVPSQSIQLVGLSDNNLLDDTLYGLTKEINTNKFIILLAHEPQNFYFYKKQNIDLVLSGHAHGGQFRLPIIGAVVAPDQGFLPEYTEGLHKEDGCSMIISRGLGNSIVPIRLFNQPEIVSIDLQAN